jgi:hypothetical protein
VNIKEKVFYLGGGGYGGAVSHLQEKTQNKSTSEQHAEENVWTQHRESKDVGRVT